MHVTVLGSGSRGNAILFDGSDGSLLIDCGFGVRTLTRRLAAVGRRPDAVNAVVLTHEHTDHASGVRAASTRWAWPVLGTAKTLDALARDADGAPARVQVLDDDTSAVAGFSLQHHAVPHDAADCRAFVVTDQQTGARAGVVLDCGHVPATLPGFLADCDLLVMESNHCPTLLVNGPYPWPLKQRIRGGSGHLSNLQASALLADCVHAGLRGVMLVHLSETNNSPTVALSQARGALRRAGFRRDAVWAARQSEAHVPISATGGVGRRAHQLTLGL